MALSTYTQLKTAIANLLNRSDSAVTDAVPDWIAMCEADLKRQLRRTKARGQYTISDTTWTLPSAIGELLSLRLVTGSPSLDKPLKIVTGYDADTMRARYADVDGRPLFANVVGRTVVFTPSPDTSYTIEATYVASLTALSDSNSTNTVLEEAPDVYLYGSAIHSAPFLGDDSRLAMWQQFYQLGVDGLNQKREAEEFGGNPKSATPSRTFG